ncbi:MAG: signal peptidase I [Caldilineales bacterium]|nr:signal peptidase I [Caldilineales bacterium]
MTEPDYSQVASETPEAAAVEPVAAEASHEEAKSFGGYLWEIVQTLVLAGLLIVFFRSFVFQNYIVEGSSMEGTLHPGERLIVSRVSYLVGEPKRGDVIVLQYPQDPSRDFVKRIIGMPGETVSITDGQVFIDGQSLPSEYYVEPMRASRDSMAPVTLAADEYWVMGDNRTGSSDSRSWGPLEERYVIGKAWLVYFPFTDFGIVADADLEPAG